MSSIWTGRGSGSRVTDARFVDKNRTEINRTAFCFLKDTDLLLLPLVFFGGHLDYYCGKFRWKNVVMILYFLLFEISFWFIYYLLLSYNILCCVAYLKGKEK